MTDFYKNKCKLTKISNSIIRSTTVGGNNEGCHKDKKIYEFHDGGVDWKFSDKVFL